MIIPVDKQGYVQNLLEESTKFIQTVETNELRLVEISGSKIQRIVPSTASLDALVQQGQRIYRVEVGKL